MKKALFYSAALLSLSAGLLSSDLSVAQDTPQGSASVQAALYRAPLPKGAGAYANIDGKQIWQWVVEQAQIARDFRDHGHPQYWGRLVATESDDADVKWLIQKYHDLGMSDTKVQTVQFYDPQWLAKSWTVTLVGGGKSVKLESAQPPYASPDTKGKEEDFEIVYVGLGTKNDFAGRDVRGKAVLFVNPRPSYNIGPRDAIALAQEKGAAAIFATDTRGGNRKMESYRAASTVPIFSLGTNDGQTIQDMIANSPPGAGPHIKVQMEAEQLPNAHSYMVWGTLPGMTDETIYVIAHRDGFFDAAGDNASGVATMLGLVAHYAKIPKEKRLRTMIFIGTDGHHNNSPGGFGREWLAANRDKLFSKTALMINAEHPAEVLTHDSTAGTTTSAIPVDWYAGGHARPQLEKIASDAFREFGVPIWDRPSARPPGGDLGCCDWFVPGLVAQSNDFIYMHTDADTPENVSWAGLEGVTRAYAKIIDAVNKLPLSALQRPVSSIQAPRIDLKGCEEWIKDSSKNCIK